MEKTKIVIIEDDPGFVEILKSMISQISYIELLDTYTNSVNASIGIAKHNPDFAIVDYEISGLNGLETIKTLDKPPKILLITGNDIGTEELVGLNVGIYLKKPLKNFEQFKSAVDYVISK